MRNLPIALFTLLALCFSVTLIAQKQVRLIGKVVDAATQAPLSYATISLFELKDSTLVAGNITDDTGLFSIEAAPGVYFAKIEFLSYQTKTIASLTISGDKNTGDMGIIALQAQATTLNEVVVQAEKSQMQMSLDKKVFNVGKDLGNAGGNAADVLDNVPSVQVDVEGNVSLRGSDNVRILIDGKPSGLIGLGSSNGLRQLPANLIDKVEVITNPSARYEAEGMSGIINIVLKKDVRTGVNGSFDLTTGYPDNHGAAINLNYRTAKLNLFSNYGLTWRNSPGDGSLYQEVYSNDTTFITTQVSDRERGGWSNNVRVGADYFINDKNTLTGAFTYRGGKQTNLSLLEYRDYLTNLGNPTAISLRTDDEKEDALNYEYALTYKRTFEKQGHELTADVRYQDNDDTENSDLAERFFMPDFTPSGTADLAQRSYNREREQLLAGQVDYVQPVGKDGKLEMGLRSTFRDIANDFLVEEYANDAWVVFPGLSNDFRYNENIHAAYLIFGNKKGKFSYQAGLRTEYSDVTTELLQTSEVNARDYLSIFPSMHITYDLPSQNAVQLSYSRRLRRPGFRELNPFSSFSDNRNFFTGNPDLDPEFTDIVEMGHIKYWEQGSLSSSVYYRYTSGKIDRIRTLNEDGVTFLTRPENLLSENAYGLEFVVSYNPFKWWTMNGSFNFYRSIVDGGNLGESFRSDTYAWFTRGTSRFTIFKNTDLQVRFDYRAPEQTTQGLRKAMYSIDLGASRDILKQKGTLTLSVRDLLNSRRMRSISEGDDFYANTDFQWRARQITLTLSYRLNQSKQRGNDKRRDEDGGGENMMY
ncbi:MAG: TonB-dependent receptor [Saprospiraceae bacterium]|nr:TonB-dependent receptor [Saprospiraceae bacterium]